MTRNCAVVSLIVLFFSGSCRNIESEDSGRNKVTDEAEKMEIAYTFLLKKLPHDNLSLIATKDDERLTLIRNIIRANRLNLEVEDYNNIEEGPDSIHYSKSTGKAVAVVDVARRNETHYYVSYYVGPEGGASKEIIIEERNGNWMVVNDDGMWSVK